MRACFVMGLTLALLGAGCDNDDGGGMDAGDVDAGDMDAGSFQTIDGGDAGFDGGDVEAGIDGGAGLTAEEFADRYLDEVCGLLLDCESKLGPLLGIATQQICHPEGRDRGLAGLPAAVASGTVVFSGPAGGVCLASIAGFTCADLIDGLAEGLMCDGVYTPTVAVGGSCTIDAECVDARCVAGASCPGTCTAFTGAGMPCSDDAECADGLSCSMGMCETRRAVGGACDNQDDCLPGLICEARMCADRPTTGQPCTSLLGISTCAGADLCVMGTCGAGGAASATCDADEPCAPGLRCNPASGTCVTLVEPGGSCSVDVECPAYFFCDGGTCAPLPVEGESCALSGACAEGVCTAGTCTRAARTEPCEGPLVIPFGACATGSFCQASSCVASTALGDACTSDPQCDQGNECRDGACRATCTP